MSSNIGNLSSDLSGILHGTTTNKVTGFTNVVQRAAKKLLLDIDPAESKRKILLNSIVSGDIFQYALPTDLKGDKIIDLYNWNNPRSDVYSNAYAENFNLGTASALSQPWVGVSGGVVNQNFTVQWENGVRLLKINNRLDGSTVIINNLSSLTSNGTPVALGSSPSVGVNSINYIGTIGSSLSFSAPISTTTAGIQISNATGVSISTYIVDNRAYFWIFITTGYTVTNINVKYGTDLGNYYSTNLTQNNEGNTFQNGWNLCSFNLSDAVTTGSPVSTAAGVFVAFLVTHSGVVANSFLINQFTIKSGENLMIQYYSKYMFKNPTTHEFLENIPTTDTTTTSNTIINLDTDAYNLMVYLTAIYCFQQINDQNASYDIDFWTKQYDQALQMYKNNYKSEIIKPKQNYYTVNRGGGYLRGNI